MLKDISVGLEIKKHHKPMWRPLHGGVCVQLISLFQYHGFKLKLMGYTMTTRITRCWPITMWSLLNFHCIAIHICTQQNVKLDPFHYQMTTLIIFILFLYCSLIIFRVVPYCHHLEHCIDVMICFYYSSPISSLLIELRPHPILYYLFRVIFEWSPCAFSCLYGSFMPWSYQHKNVGCLIMFCLRSFCWVMRTNRLSVVVLERCIMNCWSFGLWITKRWIWILE